MAVAALCEKVLQEPDGVLSLIRVVDRILQSAEGPAATPEMPIAVNLTLVVVVKSGDARGRYPMTVRLEAPSGQQVGTEMPVPVLLEGEGDRGANFVLRAIVQPGHVCFSRLG